MNPCALPLDPAADDDSARVAPDRVGFRVGWDHARHGLVPPAALLERHADLAHGWMAARAVCARRTQVASRATRQWLALRLRAFCDGTAVDLAGITPSSLAQLQGTHCPLRRTLLGGATDGPDAAVVERLSRQAGYAHGNVIVLSAAAARAVAGVDVTQALRRARAAGVGAAPAGEALEASAWWRWAALQAMVTPLAFAEAAAVPLAAWPVAPCGPCNAVQRLQVALTALFAEAGWAARCRDVAGDLPADGPRQDFNLFVGAMAPRVVQAAVDGTPMDQALADAWLHSRVQRRWQQFMLGLGETAVEALLGRLPTLPARGPAARMPRHAPSLGQVRQPQPQPAVRRQRPPLCRVAPARPIGRPSTTGLPFTV